MSIASSECIVTPDLVPSPARAGDDGRRGRRPMRTVAAGQAHPWFRFDVAVVGLGYVGLPTALAFHAAGRAVLGLDLSERRLDDIRGGRVDLVDSDRDRLAATGKTGSEAFELDQAVGRLAEARTVIVCVPTPVDAHLIPDLSLLRAACATVVAHAVEGQILILTSTTYVGATKDLLAAPLAARGLVAGTDVAVAFSPERIDPGNDRHAHEGVPRVVGGVTSVCAERAAIALGGYANHVHPVSSAEAAEMTKLVENTFRAVNIALANELAEISGLLDLDVMEVINAAATKPYGFMPFFPGPGVGGHCIPCDPHYLLWQLRGLRHNSPLIEQAMVGIAARPHRVVQRCVETLAEHGRSVAGARILVVGVAYKPDVEDVRESPALEIIAALRERGADVAYTDPYVADLRLPDGTRASTIGDPAGFRADLAIVHTAHTDVDLSWLAQLPSVLDATYRLSTPAQRVAL
jgi:UDP-N-acetyl-D-glucosamine dehydrogenase